jgi:Thaumarchaeal output domain 1
MGSDAKFIFVGQGTFPAQISAREGELFSAVVLTSPVDIGEISALLQRLPDPAVPIADFGGNIGIRNDYMGNSLTVEALREAVQQFAPIIGHLAEFPFHSLPAERVDLTVLRLAYSRNRPIEASFSHASKELVVYPMLGGTMATARHLEALAHLDLLHARHFARTNACTKCGSARLNAYDACMTCGSAHLVTETMIRHISCGWQDGESRFTKGRRLVCPKCNRELLNLGLDYETVGNVFVCHACQSISSEVSLQFTCIDCSTVTASHDAKHIDWFHYDLTEQSIPALHQGRLPSFDIAPLLFGKPRASSMQEFRLIATAAARVAIRYSRPLTVARLRLNLAALRQNVGTVKADSAFRNAVESIITALRVPDFVSSDGVNSILIGFPETPAANVDTIVNRMRSTILSSTGVILDFEVDLAEGEAIADMLAES